MLKIIQDAHSRVKKLNAGKVEEIKKEQRIPKLSSQKFKRGRNGLGLSIYTEFSLVSDSSSNLLESPYSEAYPFL